MISGNQFNCLETSVIDGTMLMAPPVTSMVGLPEKAFSAA